MKFPSVSGDILTVHVDKKIARECYAACLKMEPFMRDLGRMSRGRSQERRSSRGQRTSRVEPKPERREHTIALVELDPQMSESRLEAGGRLTSSSFADEDYTTSLGTSFAMVDGKIIHQTLKKNVDLFAWTTFDMLGVSQEIITHKLSVH